MMQYTPEDIRRLVPEAESIANWEHLWNAFLTTRAQLEVVVGALDMFSRCDFAGDPRADRLFMVHTSKDTLAKIKEMEA
jgi:hypothetical protein